MGVYIFFVKKMEIDYVTKSLKNEIARLIKLLEKHQRVDYKKEFLTTSYDHDSNTQYNVFVNANRMFNYMPIEDEHFDMSRIKVLTKDKTQPIDHQYGEPIRKALIEFGDQFDYEELKEALMRYEQERHMIFLEIVIKYLPKEVWLETFFESNYYQIVKFFRMFSHRLPFINITNINNVDDPFAIFRDNIEVLICICYYTSPYLYINQYDIIGAIDKVDEKNKRLKANLLN